MDKNRNFLRKIVQDDLRSGKYKKIVTRFPPEPNGFPHIGHAKSIALNFGIAKEFDGVCNLRMDDTNPTTEDTKYVEALKDAVKWLGFEWDGSVKFTSDYFYKLYEYAIELIKMDKAYVDSLSEDEMREYRGSVTKSGVRSRYANRSIDENLDLFERMRRGEFRDGEHVLRAKIDMSSANMKLRDPLLYRIRHSHHFRSGDKWAIYPMYDFAHPLSDYIEGVTHSFCTLEFENNRDIYDWLLDTLNLKPPRPYQYEFARLNINYTVMSKRKLLELVQKGLVNGWDDPRLPTIAGLRRRGYTPRSILNFCEMIGVAKANSVVDISQLEFCIRDDLNQRSPRVMCILDPLKVTIENYDGFEEIEASYYPPDVKKEGARLLPFSKEIYIDRSDFEENPPKGYFRLTLDQPVRLKFAYIIRCKEVIKDEDGNIIEIKAEYYPDSKSGEDRSGIKVKSAIHWVEGTKAKRAEIRVYDRLYKKELPQSLDDLNPNSLEIIKDALIEPWVIDEKIDDRFQFEREGYFFADPIDFSDDMPVFNKIVSLKDSWNKKKKANNNDKSFQKPQIKNNQKEGEVAPMSENQQTLYERYTKELNLNKEVANTLARDERLSSFFDDSLKESDLAIVIANIVTNEVARELKQKELSDLLFSPKDVSELAKMIEDETISTKIAKEVFEKMSKSGKEPHMIVKEENLEQISNPKIILSMVDEVIAQNPQNLQKYRDGNKKLFGFFVGQVLKKSQGKANPKVVNKLVKKSLEES